MRHDRPAKMWRRILGIAAVLAMATSAPMASAASAAPPDSARTFLVELYRHYPTADTPNAFDPTGADGPKVFAPTLLALIRQDQKLAGGEVGALEGDPLCDCQDDSGLRVKIGPVSPAGPGAARAVVTLTFTGHSPAEIRRLVIKLAATRVGWRIADIESDSEPSLRAYLARSNKEAAAHR